MPQHGPRKAQPARRAPRTEVVIVVAGLIAAAGSSVMAYRHVGPYGDGPLNVGLYRAEDPETGEQQVYRDVPMDDGTVLRYLFGDSSRKLQQVLIMRVVHGKLETLGLHMNEGGVTRFDAGGRTVEKNGADAVKVGFSLRGNGVIDAWEYRDRQGRLVKIEVSRRQDGKVDRWEFYEADQLIRVEEDENLDGRVDRWLNYEAGILVKETKDKDGDGRPDPGR